MGIWSQKSTYIAAQWLPPEKGKEKFQFRSWPTFNSVRLAWTKGDWNNRNWDANPPQDPRMRICQNFWRLYKGFNLENVTKNNGPMSKFVMKTIGSVEIIVFQKRECWLWRSLLFLKGLKEHWSWISSTANHNFLGERAKISHSLSLSFNCCIRWSSTDLQEITGYSGALSRAAERPSGAPRIRRLVLRTRQ